MRRGEYDEAELERQLASRGFFYRFFGRWMKAITKEWQLYPVGVVFGLGFDTATEVALLATTALLASSTSPGTRSSACRSCSPRSWTPPTGCS
jgi:high-affinity nickel-transport protein